MLHSSRHRLMLAGPRADVTPEVRLHTKNTAPHERLERGLLVSGVEDGRHDGDEHADGDGDPAQGDSPSGAILAALNSS